MENYATKYPHFLHGCDYNPEQWLQYPEILEQDMKYMKKAHCNVVSLGIFSWSFLEPEEGRYNFEYMDEIVDRLERNGIQIILATPSGARPRWMAEKYPEVLRVNKSGVKEIYGFRHNHCYTSPIYREKTAAINRLLAQRYGKRDNLILWHISNEYGGECHCELCQQAFRQWLREKYEGSLDKLNHAWWSGFWSHTVTDWEQIHSPMQGGEPDEVMTGLFIDWKSFVTYQTTEFMKNEIRAVKEVTPDIPVTANFMGPYQQLDYHYMKDFVDVISWDDYPEWHSDRGNALEAYSTAFAHDMNRGLKQKPFLLMECTPSLTNWLPVNKLKRPGMHRLAAMQAVAHGSDSVQYFQWRKGRGGSEKFHGAVIDHNGKAEGRVFEEVKQVGQTLEKLEDVLGSMPDAKVGLVYDFRNRWALENASGFQLKDKKYKRTCINHYKEFWKRGIDVDVIGPERDFGRYQVLILPMLYSMTRETIERVERFVAAGGTAIATYVTGYVNETDLCYLGGFPGGRLKEVFGLTADEVDTLYPSDRNCVKLWRKEYAAVDYCELITPTSAQVLGVYGQDFYAGMPAVLKNRYGDGTAYYIGCRDTGELLHDFYEHIIAEAQLPGLTLPEGVTVHSRRNENGTFIFAENYGEKEAAVSLPGDYEDMETGQSCCGQMQVGGFDVKILRRK